MTSNLGKTILLVDDSEIIALATKKLLEQNGYRVIVANSGKSAIEFCESETIHLILMDVDLGSGIGGPETTKQILQKKDLPVIFLTSHTGKEVFDSVSQIQRYGYVRKGSGDFLLLSAIEMALELFESKNALKESEARLKEANRIAGIADWSYDFQKNQAFWSEDIYNLFEISPNDIQLSYQTYLELLHPDDKDFFEQLFREAIAEKKQFEVHHRIVTPDGKVKYIIGKAETSFDQDGNPLQMVGTIQNVTSQKLLENKAVENGKFIEALVNMSPLIFYIVDIVKNKIVYSNDTIEKILGYSFEELHSMGEGMLLNVMHPDDFQNYFETIYPKTLSLGDNEKIKFQYRCKHKEGHWVWLGTVVSIYKRNPDGSPMQIFGVAQDVTENTKYEKELQESEEKLRSVIEASNDGIWEWNLLDNQVIWSDRVYQMFGISRESFNQTFEAIFNLVHTDDRAKFTRALNLHIKENQPYDLEMRYRRGDDSYGHYLCRGQAIKDKKGKCIRMIGSIRDITERKIEEERNLQSLNFINTIINSSPVGILTYKISGECVSANPASCKIVGTDSLEALRALNFWDLGTVKKLNLAETVKGLVESEKTLNIEIHNVSAFGKEFWVHAYVDTFILKGERHILLSMTDILETKKSEYDLAKEKELLATTLRSIGDGVITTDTKGLVLTINKTAEMLTGWSVKDAVGKPIEEIFQIINEHTKEKRTPPVKKIMETGEIVELENHTCLISKNGEEYIIADSGAPIVDKDSKIIGVVLVFRDITEKQKLLNNSQRAEKLSSLGLLAGGIAHDFNNLLSGLFGYLDLASHYSAKDSKEFGYIEKAKHAFTRAKALTQQLITFSKGGQPLRVTGSIQPMLIEATQFALSGSNIKVRFIIDDDLSLCDFDEGQMSQVIDNIVINAKQAMPEGGKLEITAKNCEISQSELIDLKPGNYVKISFKDFGSGIPANILQNIFDPYFTTKETGNGLGLATVYSIIEKHEGKITVESSVGHGTTFHIFIPVSKNLRTNVSENRSDDYTGEGNILIMDDEDFIHDIYENLLESIGFKADQAMSGEEALEKFKKSLTENSSYTAIIMDLTIPGGMGGKEAIRILREMDQQIPVFVSSGYSEDPIMANPGAYGFTDKLPKPFKKSDLIDLLIHYSKKS